jgi:uncharacterized membrane protein YedE/YeeE
MASFPKPGAGRPGTVQNVPYSTAAALGAVFGVETYLVRLCATSACYYLISGGNGAAATAATASNAAFLPANWVEFVQVSPGQTLSVLQAPTGGLITGTAGSLNVVELS